MRSAAVPQCGTKVRSHRRRGPVVKRIEHQFAELEIQVRFLAGPPQAQDCQFTIAFCSASMRSSSDGCVENTRPNRPRLSEIFIVASECWRVSTLFVNCWSLLRAAIIFVFPTNFAPPLSARNSRRRENENTIIEAKIPKII